MYKITDEEIVEELSVCPYCYEPERGNISCCGENHFEDGYLLDNGEIILKSDAIVVEIPRYIIEERLEAHRADKAYDFWKDEQ